MDMTQLWDVAVIGAGVCGAAVAQALGKYRLNCVVLEACADVAQGASKANSAIVHAGYDCESGTRMAQLNVQGNAMMEALCADLSVPFVRRGSYVVAFDGEDEAKLRDLLARGEANGVPGLEIITGDELRAREPHVSADITHALWAPSAGLVSPYELTIALCDNAVDNGVALLREYRVAALARDGEGFTITAEDGRTIRARYVINAAGVYADEINAMAGGAPFRIIPRRGEYMLLDKTAGEVVRSTIFQTPSKMGKGCLVSPTVHGTVFAGPTAEDIDDKEDKSTTAHGLDTLKTLSLRSVPSLPLRAVITAFTGLRAQVEGYHDFIIRAEDAAPGFVNVAGICSPGLSSAPAIAPMVIEILAGLGLALEEKPEFNPKRVRPKPFFEMDDEERAQAIAQNPLYGRIICRCETITEAEIVSAIHEGIGARTLDGVKHRTRAGMGRCQGGFCGPKVMGILSRELGIPMEELTKNERGSYLLAGRLHGEDRG